MRWCRLVSRRQPRGRTLASELVPVAVRFQPDERQALDDVVQAVQAAGDGQKVTLTAAVIAAFRVVVKHGLPAQATEGL